MFTSPAIASEIARARHRDLVARAESDRLSRRVNSPIEFFVAALSTSVAAAVPSPIARTGDCPVTGWP